MQVEFDNLRRKLANNYTALCRILNDANKISNTDEITVDIEDIKTPLDNF